MRKVKAKQLVYAAISRCQCGLGLAYNPKGESGHLNGYWDCSGILLGTADRGVQHSDIYPFTFYEIKPESKERGTTREEKS